MNLVTGTGFVILLPSFIIDILWIYILSCLPLFALRCVNYLLLYQSINVSIPIFINKIVMPMLCIHMLYHIQIPAHINNIDMLTFLPSLSQEKLSVSEILLLNYPL